MKNSLIFTLLLIAFSAICAISQCDLPPKIEYLSGNNIRAAINNRANNFWNLTDAKFQVPYNGPDAPSTIFSSNLWLSGKIDQMVHVNHSNFGNMKCAYVPGPVIENEHNYEDERAHNWNRLFNVNGQDILAHIEDFKDGKIDVERPDIFYWPASGNKHFEDHYGFVIPDQRQGMAPFYEPDASKNGIYEPELGEYPLPAHTDKNAIPTQHLWCVFGTAWSEITNIVTLPKIEIQQSFWAYGCEDELLNNSIFSRHTIINKDSLDIDSFTIGLWMDPDLGCYTDDYIGCDSLLNTVYFYNADSEDGENGMCPGGVNNYGKFPPLQTITVLSPELTSFNYYKNNRDSTPSGAFNLYDAESIFNLMTARWADGKRMTRGGNGYDLNSTNYTRFLFHDSPTDTLGWSMFTTPPIIEDIRMVLSSDLSKYNTASLAAGDVVEFDVAYSFFQDSSLNHISIVDEGLSQIPDLRRLYNSGFSICTPLKCHCDCVWPGDTNKDGYVDYLDAVNIYRGLGNEGPQRTKPLSWTSEDVPDWNSILPDGINAKYADVDGNGKVEMFDAQVLDDFLYRQNTCLAPRKRECITGPDLVWSHSTDSILGNSAIIRSQLSLSKDEALIGITLEFEIEEDLLEVILAQGQLRSSNIASPDKSYRTEVGNKSVFSITNVFLSTSDLLSTDNKVFSLIIRPKNIPKTYHQPYIEGKVCNATAYFSDGTTLRLKAQNLKYPLPDSVVITGVEDPRPKEITVYPNPTKDLIQFEINEGHGDTFIIFSSDGQELIQGMILDGITTVNISDLKAGLYFIRARGKHVFHTGKFIVQQQHP